MADWMENSPTRVEDVRDTFDPACSRLRAASASGGSGMMAYPQQVEKGHGRLEQRLHTPLTVGLNMQLPRTLAGSCEAVAKLAPEMRTTSRVR